MTNNQAPSNVPVVALIDLPGLIAPLSEAGFTVVGGQGVEADVPAARNLRNRDPKPPILIANRATPQAGMVTFVTKAVADEFPVLLLDVATPGPLAHPLALRMQLPTTLGALAEAINLAFPPQSRIRVDAKIADSLVDADIPAPQVDQAERTSPWDRYAAVPTAPVEDPTPEPQPSPAPEPAAADHDPHDASEPSSPSPAPVAAPLPAWLVAHQQHSDANPEPAAPNGPAVLVTQFPGGVSKTSIAEHLNELGGAPSFAALGYLLVVTSAKGGAAKTTTSRLLAQRAAELGMRVVLIDGNGGQNGQRKMMRVGEDLPSIYDFAVGATDARGAICTPDQVNAQRPTQLTPVRFASVFAPPGQTADHAVVTPAVYAAITRYAREVADIVIVDTQMVEAPDMRDPNSFAVAYTAVAARDLGGWMLALFDNNKEAYENLFGNGSQAEGILAAFQALGVPTSRVLTLATLVNEQVEFDDSRFAAATATFGLFLGHTRQSAHMSGTINAGLLEHADPSVRAALDAVLHHVTGLDQFQPSTPKSRRGLFRKGPR